jgi:hypothetical protein
MNCLKSLKYMKEVVDGFPFFGGASWGIRKSSCSLRLTLKVLVDGLSMSSADDEKKSRGVQTRHCYTRNIASLSASGLNRA